MRVLVGAHSTFPPPDGVPSAIAQRDLGLDWVVVDLPEWGDRITGMAGQLAGACLGDLMPVPFSPLPCRQIRIQARLRNRTRLLQPAFQETRGEVTEPLKIAVTGPYTLSRLAHIETTAYRDWRHVAEDLANHLADEVRAVVAGGARWIQLDEPSILQAPGDIRFLRELLEPIQDAVEPNAELLVVTNGAIVGDLFAHLNSLPGAAIGLDAVSSPDVIRDIAATGSGKPLALGLVGTGDTPAVEQLVASIEAASRRYQHEVLYLQPNCGLHSLTAAAANEKLTALLRARMFAGIS